MPNLNFQDYITNSVELIEATKEGAQLLKAVTLSPASILSTVLNSYMQPVFQILGQVQDYIPTNE